MQGKYLLICPAVQCKCQAYAIVKSTPGKFNIIKSKAVTASMSLQCRAFNWAVKNELSPLFSIGPGGAVDVPFLLLFYYFSEKKVLAFHVNCLPDRQFT